MAATSENTQSPERQNFQASASYVTGSHNIKFGFQYQCGDFWHSVDANADLTQQYRSPIGTPRYSVPDSVIVRNTPLVYGERLNRDIGIYAQDSWRFKRMTLNAGIRWETVNAKVHASSSPAGRWAPARQFEEIENVRTGPTGRPGSRPCTTCSATARRRSKYSLNRYNQSRTTGIAADYNPLASLTSASLPWRDLNGDDIAEGTRTFNPDGTVTNCVFLTAGLRNRPRGPRAEFRRRRAQRVRRLSADVESRERPRAPARDSAAPVGNGQLVPWQLPQPDHDDQPQLHPRGLHAVHGLQPPVGRADSGVRAHASRARPTRNLDTFDPERERQYESFNFEFNARPGRGINLFGGLAVERQLDVACTAPDDPNTLRFCDDFQNGVPYRKSFKLSGSLPLPWDFTLSGVFQSNHGTASSRTLVADAWQHDLSGHLPGPVPRWPGRFCPRPCSARPR